MAMHIKKIVCGVVSIMLVACFVAARGELEEDILERLRIQTTNSWGICMSDYHLAVETNMAELARLRTGSARQMMKVWYMEMLDFAVPTNSYSSYGEWQAEKSSHIAAFSRFFTGVDCTDTWLHVADVHAHLATEMKLVAEIKSNAMAQAATETLETLGSNKAAMQEEFDHLADQEKAADSIKWALVDQFGLKGIPRLPVSDRWIFCSNYVERAMLPASDAERIYSSPNMAE